MFSFCFLLFLWRLVQHNSQFRSTLKRNFSEVPSLRTTCELTSRLKFKNILLLYLFLHQRLSTTTQCFKSAYFKAYSITWLQFPSEPLVHHRIHLFNVCNNKKINCFSKKIATADICLHCKNDWVKEQLPQREKNREIQIKPET